MSNTLQIEEMGGEFIKVRLNGTVVERVFSVTVKHTAAHGLYALIEVNCEDGFDAVTRHFKTVPDAFNATREVGCALRLQAAFKLAYWPSVLRAVSARPIPIDTKRT